MFYLPGDLVESEIENMHFHKGLKYEISHVFAVSNGCNYMVKDKYGFDVPYSVGRFKSTPKLEKITEERQLKSRLKFFWDNTELMVVSTTNRYDFKNIDFYELSTNAHYGNAPTAIGLLKKYKLDPTGSDGWKYNYDQSVNIFIYKIEEFYDYFINLFKTSTLIRDWQYSFHLPHLAFNAQGNLDCMQFLIDNKFPVFDRSLVNLPEEIDTRSMYDSGKIKFKDFLDYLASLTFDKKTFSLNIEKELVSDVLTLFRDLPGSHGSTSVSKILTGKSKMFTDRKEFGKYKDFIKFDQLFEFVSSIDLYMSANNVFTTKESYSSAAEWRGTFEFIGSKLVDTKKLETYFNFLNNIKF